MVVALVYAFLAGLHTVFDFDMGWHLATGRYVVQHHAIPSTDILSYTSPGALWLYPPFAGVLLYGVSSVWGYAGLSWFCALMLVLTVACILRRPSQPGSGITAALAIIAVPVLATRATPRADLFTTFFFSIFLVEIWDFHRRFVSVFAAESGQREYGAQGPRVAQSRAGKRLWILPLVMLLWVNCHPGFIAGIGIVAAYLLIEAMEWPFSMRRPAALQRIRMAWAPLTATIAVTLLNPYGPKIFKASLLLLGYGQPSVPNSGITIVEESGVPMSLQSLAQALDWRNPASGFWWLALVAVVSIVVALWKRQFGPALLIAVALYAPVHWQRYQGLFSIVVVVVSSTILSALFIGLGQQSAQNRHARRRRADTQIAANSSPSMRLLGLLAAGALCLLAGVRVGDLVSNRYYVESTLAEQFGVGESWWYPERAAAFIQREHLPGNVFQLYSLGGFTAWRLGPTYADFVDGRGVSPAVLIEQQELLATSPDSEVWEAEADRRKINILFFSLDRFAGLGTPDLMSLCESRLWRPVYMDDVSMVLLRNRPENRPWIERHELSCQTHDFGAPPPGSRVAQLNFYANVGTILCYLGRNAEAKEALDRAETAFSGDASVHIALGYLYEANQQLGDAEREYKTALSIKRDWPGAWDALGHFYAAHHRYAEARQDFETAAQLTTIAPYNHYLLLARIDLALQQPEKALEDLNRAERSNPFWRGREDLDRNFFAQIAEGRAQAYQQLGDWQRAIAYQTEATERTPQAAQRWQALASLYRISGQDQLAEHALQQAQNLSK